MGLKVLVDEITEQLEKMKSRANDRQAFMNRIIYPMYQNAQRKRWMTENESEGDRWEALNPTYAISKLKKFVSYPGAGKKMLIATGQLYKDVIGGGEGHRKIVSDDRLSINWTTPYSVYVDEVREFSDFGIETEEKMYESYAEFLIKGIERMLL